MTLTPLIEASPAVQRHVVTVLPSFILGTWLIFFSRKGSAHHKLLGKAYFLLMAATSVASFFVHERMPDSPILGLSPIHLLAAFVLFALWRAFAAAKRRDIQTHRIWMLGVYVGSLIINGAVNIFVVDGVARDVLFGA